MKDQTNRAAIYRRVEKNSPEGGEFGLQRVGEEEQLFRKPTLLCCGGGYIRRGHVDGIGNSDEQKSANGFAKVGHSLLGFRDHVEKGDPIDIVSVVYPEDSQEKVDKNIARITSSAFKGRNTFSDPADNFMYDHIEPLLVDKAKKPLPIDQVEKNLRNINIVAHSYGGAFVNQLGNALYARLKELKFSPEEIRDATSQVLVVTAGSAVPLTSGKASFTTLDIVNAKDTESGARYEHLEMDQKVMMTYLMKKAKRLSDVEPNQPANPLNVIPSEFSARPRGLSFDVDSTKAVVWASAPLIRDKKGWPAGDAMDFDMMRSNACGEFVDSKTELPVEQKRDESAHQVETYFHLGTGTHGFMTRTIMSSALANGINNGLENAARKDGEFEPIGGPLDMVKCPDKLLYPLAMVDHKEEGPDGTVTTTQIPRDFTKIAHMIGYDERIAKACGEELER